MDICHNQDHFQPNYNSKIYWQVSCHIFLRSVKLTAGEIVLNKNNPYKIKVNFFYKDNNPECQLTRRALYKILDNYIDKITMREINFDHNKKICDDFRIYGVPTLLIIKNNKILNRYSGILDSKEIQLVLDLLLERH